MSKRITQFFLFITISLNIQALETDQFVTWEVELKDSTNYVNQYINKNIKLAIKEANNKGNYSCEKMAQKALDWNGRTTQMLSMIEKHMYDAKEVDRYPRITDSERGVVSSSIYSNVDYFNLKIFGISMQMNGVYFGIDKLGHFITVGRDYYKTYLRKIKKKKSRKYAMKKAIKRGIFSEQTYYGFLISGVFSYADLESNYQGLLFAISFCEGANKRLTKNDQGKWELKEDIDITPYVTPNWDESFYTNVYSSKRFKQITSNLTDYCAKRDLPIKSKRFEYYQSIDQKNLSTEYLGEMIENGKLKDPYWYSLEYLCEK